MSSQQLALTDQMSLSNSVAKHSSLLAEVRALGQYPKRYKRPADDGQKSENSLAVRLRKAWTSLPEGERQQLEEMKQQLEEPRQPVEELVSLLVKKQPLEEPREQNEDLVSLLRMK